MKKIIQTIGVKVSVAICFFILPVGLIAQICTGSLGDAVVNVTFGTGGNPGPSLPVATTNYSFTSNSCPDDGSYTVVSSTAGCFGNTWHGLSEDHTPGDVNGYMMLANASVNPGDFYVDTVRNLCAGTNYEFGAWLTNVILPSSCNGNATRPQLTFRIETTTGVVLGTYNTGEIAAVNNPVWKQYGFFFTTPTTNSTVVIRLTNNAPGGCGNDLALDDITFRPCGPTATAGFANISQPSLDLCIGNMANTTISANISAGYIAPAYQWQLFNGTDWVDIAGATAITYIRTPTPGTGIYRYRLTVAESGNIGISNCRVASNEATITIHDLPIATAVSNTPLCQGTTLNLMATGGNSYQWIGPDGFVATGSTPNLQATLASQGTYRVIVADAFGCIDSAFTTVTIVAAPITDLISTSPSICAGDSVQLQAGNSGNQYAWLPANGLSDAAISNPIAKPDSTTTYIVTVTNSANCSDTAAVIVSVINKPKASAGADKVIIKGQSVVLDGSIENPSSVNFSWVSFPPPASLNNTLILTPSANPLVNTQYILQAISGLGCGLTTDTVNIKVYNDLYIPNAFSPNGIGGNNTWRIESLLAYPNAILTVYNRFGEKIFESSAASKDWDGTYKNMEQPPGAYVYMINLKNGRPIIKGTVMILR